jgi:hypothetical protein
MTTLEWLEGVSLMAGFALFAGLDIGTQRDQVKPWRQQVRV